MHPEYHPLAHVLVTQEARAPWPAAERAPGPHAAVPPDQHPDGNHGRMGAQEAGVAPSNKWSGVNLATGHNPYAPKRRIDRLRIRSL